MHGLNIAVYDRDNSALRWREAANATRALRFGSALPGGFTSCSLVIDGPARSLPLAAGQALAVQQGSKICWWGWIEDVVTIQRGSQEQTAVLALGPWQQLNQRIASMEFDDVTSTYIIRDMLYGYCPDLAQDYSQLVNSGRPMTRSWERTTLADIVGEVCATGDSSDRPLLFAVWEPPGSRVRVNTSGNLLDDSELEQLETYWDKGSDLLYYITSQYVSPRYSWKWAESASSGITHKRRVNVSAGADYVFEYMLYWTAYSGMTTNSRVDWFDVDGDMLSITYGPDQTSDGVTTGWRAVRDVHTAPAGAVTAKISVGGSVGSGGGAARYLCVDDIYFYLELGAVNALSAPRAELWARDLTDYDYTLRTAELADGLQATLTTRDLANYVLATYSTSSVTGAAEDATSQALYRRRDYVVAAGSVAQKDAEAQRDVYLARHANPGTEMSTFTVRGPGAVRTSQGLPVDPALLRAGDRLRIVDGRLAGTVLLLEEVTWEDGAAQCRPESYEDVTRTLARV